MAGSFDRSKFQATQVATMQQQSQQVEAVVQKNGFEKTEYHKNEVGDNIYRLYPAHPEAVTQAFAFCRVTHYLVQQVPTQDKKGFEYKKKHIFNARTHGGYAKDVIEEYIRIATEIINGQKLTAAALKTRLAPIQDYSDGIKPQVKWMIYADKIKITPGGPGKPQQVSAIFGILELSDAQKNRLNVISQNEGANEVIAVDPFTDPDTGRAVIIRKKLVDDKGQKVAPKDMYTVELDSAYDKNSMKIRLFPLSDAQLETFMGKELLEKRYTKCYKRADFEKAVAGLEIFDMQNEYGVFGTPQWDAVLAELDEMIPQDEEAEEEEEGSAGGGDQFARMTRDQLKNFIRTERLGIMPTQSMTDDTLRDLVRQKWESVQTEAAGHNTFPEDELTDDTSDGGQNLTLLQDARDADEAPAPAAPKGSSRMAALRSKVQSA